MPAINRFPRRYVLEFGGAPVAYTAALAISILLLKGMAAAAPLRIPLALAPMVPGIAIVVAVVRQINRIDELQRRIPLESIAIAFAGTAVITFGYGFLQNVGFPQLSWFGVWPIMAMLWAVASLVAFWRYR